MLTNVCPHCQAYTLFEVVWSKRDFGHTRNIRYYATLECKACHVPSSGLLDEPKTGIYRMWPEKVGGKEFRDVPEHIADAADEAYRCSSINALRAAVLLARSVIEATAKEKSISKGSLWEKIDVLHKQGFIREHIKDGAHEVRLLGNDMAHGDFVEPIDTEDAELILTLMTEVLDEVFQSPARVERARQKRANKPAKQLG